MLRAQILQKQLTFANFLWVTMYLLQRYLNIRNFLSCTMQRFTWFQNNTTDRPAHEDGVDSLPTENYQKARSRNVEVQTR